MVYELAHWVKANLGFVWDVVEWMNGCCFGVMHRKSMLAIPDILANASTDEYTIRMASTEDVNMMVRFFSEQPQESFSYFHPHGFEEKEVKRIVDNKAWILFVVAEKTDKENVFDTNDGSKMTTANEMVGYCLMRSFANGATYKGYMVDYRWRGKGISKIMGWAMNDVADSLHLKMYKSISPDNVASMAATKAVNDVKVIKKMKNGDLLVECVSKKR